jgi:hypothetical protein
VTIARGARPAAPAAAAGVDTNARITATIGALLFVLFAAEGATILLGVRAQLPAHVFIGMLLIPPAALKLAATTYRFARYYTGDPAYVDRGPPSWLLRLAGPIVALSTIAVLATGIADAFAVPSRQLAGGVHKISFVVWFGAMTIHVLGHLRETPTLVLAGWRGRPADRLVRIAAVVSTLAVGLALATWSLHWTVSG